MLTSKTSPSELGLNHKRFLYIHLRDDLFREHLLDLFGNFREGWRTRLMSDEEVFDVSTGRIHGYADFRADGRDWLANIHYAKVAPNFFRVINFKRSSFFARHNIFAYWGYQVGIVQDGKHRSMPRMAWCFALRIANRVGEVRNVWRPPLALENNPCKAKL